MKFRPCVVLLCVTTIVLWICLAAFPVRDFDFWFHLATGRYVIDNHVIPSSDPFSHTATGRSWITHEWLAQVLLYSTYAKYGLSGPLVMKCGIMGAVAALLCVLGWRLGASVPVTALLLTMTAYGVTFRAFLRPHVATDLLMAVLVLILRSPSVTTSSRRWWLLPPLFAVWSNLHSGFVFGLLVLGIHLLVPAISGQAWRNRPERLRSVLPLLFSSLACLLNPSSYKAFLYPFRFLVQPVFLQTISELKPIYHAAYRHADFLTAFICYTGLYILAMAISKRRPNWIDIILLLLFLPLAVSANRNVPLFFIATAPGAFQAVAAMDRRLVARFRKPWLPVTACLLVATMQAALLYRTAASGMFMAEEGFRAMGWGRDELQFPHGAARFLETHPIPGNMLNSFAFGGYLIWHLYPDPRVFIDGRLFVYPPQVVSDYISFMSGRSGLAELRERYGVTHLVLEYPRDRSQVTGIYQSIAADPTWRLLYWDDNSLVYGKDLPAARELIQQFGYRYIDPLRSSTMDLDRQINAAPEEVAREARENLRFNPDCEAARLILGRTLTILGRPREAVPILDEALRRRPESPMTHLLLARALASAGQHGEAELHYHAVLALAPNHFQALLELGWMLHRQGYPDRAETLYLRAYRINRRDLNLLNNLGILNADRRHYDQARRYWLEALAIDPGATFVRHNLERLEHTR
ncbi:tetratricopeptide repeat protein [bacterium]|nr:tetratricopeptide repeat protein [candidate division CSSED10-310 bacterium]